MSRRDLESALGALGDGARGILGRALAATEKARFSKYLNLLLDWQRIVRLVGSRDPVWIVDQLMLDSLLFLRVLPPVFRSMIDIGSGAGIPGIPIKIVRSDCRLVLVESRRRRASFLTTVIRELGLADSEVLNTRAEALVGTLAGSFDVAVMRCAGAATKMLAVGAEFVAPGGVVVIAGPPGARAGDGEFEVEVPGVRPGTTRRFLVWPKPELEPRAAGGRRGLS